MTFTFTAMLCLGLTLGLRTPALAGSLPKPVLSVQPDSVISTHTEVIFLCEGIRGAKEYRLYKEGYPYPYLWSTKITQKPGDKAEFSFSNIGHQQAGLYQCQYETQAESSEYSDSLELVVTGVYGQPSLSALPSPVVTSGGNVTLQCVSWQKYMLILTLEGQQKLSWRLDSQYNLYTGMFQALFFVAPLTPKKRWIFRCYSYDRSIPQVWSYPSEPLEILISGNLKKTTIKAEPGPVIAIRSAMTIWCQGILDAEIYVLHKEGNQKPWRTQTPKKSWKKAKFSIPSVTQQHAGQYRCYSYSSAGWTEHSNTLELVVTGIYNFDKPKLLAMPSHVVTSGGSMTLQCVSLYHYDKFILTKEDQIFPSSMETQYMHSSRQYQAQFSRGHMTPNCTGTFRCYGYYKHTPQLWSVPSEPLEIHISGLSRKPYLLAHQGYILDPGMKLILQCVSDVNYDRFVLYKVGGAINMQHHSKQTQAGLCLTNFTLGYVRHDTGGQYICYGAHNHSSEWSASSDPVDILITGQLPVTPTLSVKPNSTVHSGQNVTLLCWLKYQVDTFILSKEGSVHQPLHLKSKFQDGQFQAKFFMSALTSTFMGTYRCYASQDSSLYLLSFASAPVELIVSEPTRVSSSPPSRNMPAAGLESYLKALIGVSVTFLLIIIFIFFLLRRRHQGNFRKDAPKETELSLPAGATEPITRDRGPQKRSNPAAITQEDSLYASVEDMQPENGVDLDSQKLSDDDSQGQTYAEVKPSRLRRAEVFLPSVIPRECLNTRDEQPEEGREVESQAEESKESQDVTYAQLDRRDLHLLSPGQGNETGCCSSRGVPKKQVAMTCQNA